MHEQKNDRLDQGSSTHERARLELSGLIQGAFTPPATTWRATSRLFVYRTGLPTSRGTTEIVSDFRYTSIADVREHGMFGEYEAAQSSPDQEEVVAVGKLALWRPVQK